MVSVNIDGKTVSVPKGTKLKEIISTDMPCGGRGRCGKCKVFAQGNLSPFSVSEMNNLTAEERKNGIRLACMVNLEGDCTIQTISKNSENKILTDGKFNIEVNEPIFKKYGISIDIGTTTIAAKLYDIHGNELCESTGMNPQAKWGADVISRIEASLKGEKHALAKTIRTEINNIIEVVAQKTDISAKDIDGIVLTGNTAMLHLLTDTDVEPLSKVPFEAKRLFNEELSAKDLDLTNADNDATVYLPPCISAFIGADTVCALIASEIDTTDDTKILVDIGTNGEMALFRNCELLVCSTAAGPSFEGVGISMGMSGKNGAIDHAETVNGKICAHVIGETEAVGICGSGLIDVVKCLLETGIIDETGYLEDDPVHITGKVFLTQEDMRMVQLAKSSIYAGINTMLITSGVELNEVPKLLIAGGFGSYLNTNNAGRIGLLPMELIPRSEILGNAALSGSAMLLLNKSMKIKATEIALKAKVIPLSANPIFTEEYMEQMMFPTI